MCGKFEAALWWVVIWWRISIYVLPPGGCFLVHVVLEDGATVREWPLDRKQISSRIAHVVAAQRGNIVFGVLVSATN